MLSRSTSRVAALLGAGALIVSFGTPLAGAQEQGSLDTESVTNGLGGSAASVGSGDLGSNIAGGTCVALDPTLPFLTNTLNLEVTDVSDEPGVAGFNAELLGGISSSADLRVEWTNVDTGDTGEVVYDGVGVNDLFPDIDSYQTAETGAGTIEWNVTGHHSSALISGGSPLASLGDVSPVVPGSTAAYSACSGTAEIS